MKRILITTVAVIGFAGAAFAQQAPFLSGDYSANTLNEYNGTADTGARDRAVDYMSTASMSERAAPMRMDDANNSVWNQNYSGR